MTRHKIEYYDHTFGKATTKILVETVEERDIACAMEHVTEQIYAFRFFDAIDGSDAQQDVSGFYFLSTTTITVDGLAAITIGDSQYINQLRRQGVTHLVELHRGESFYRPLSPDDHLVDPATGQEVPNPACADS